jgi:hypothetical protein
MKETRLKDIRLNDGTGGLPKNPRFIRDERFRALCDSIRDNPEYMPLRPIVIDEDGIILGGNMRYRACKDLKIDPLPVGWVKVAAGLSVEKKKRFIILDNRGFGEDDMDLLANEWDIEELIAAGFDQITLGFEDLQKSDIELNDVDMNHPPNMAWVLIGVPLDKWAKVAGLAEKAAAIDGSIVETTANDRKKED